MFFIFNYVIFTVWSALQIIKHWQWRCPRIWTSRELCGFRQLLETRSSGHNLWPRFTTNLKLKRGSELSRCLIVWCQQYNNINHKTNIKRRARKDFVVVNTFIILLTTTKPLQRILSMEKIIIYFCVCDKKEFYTYRLNGIIVCMCSGFLKSFATAMECVGIVANIVY